MDDEADIALFQRMQTQQRPASSAPLSDVLHASSDPRAQALAKQALGTNDVEFLLSLLSSPDAAVLEALQRLQPSPSDGLPPLSAPASKRTADSDSSRSM